MKRYNSVFCLRFEALHDKDFIEASKTFTPAVDATEYTES